MARFKTTYNAKEFPHQGEFFTQVSKTIPDQSLSVKQIMQRYAQGLPLDGVRVPIYNGEDHLPDWEKLDLSERADLVKEARQQTRELQEKAQFEHQQEQARKRQEKEKQEYQEKQRRYREQTLPFEDLPNPSKDKDNPEEPTR